MRNERQHWTGYRNRQRTRRLTQARANYSLYAPPTRDETEARDNGFRAATVGRGEDETEARIGADRGEA